MALQKNIDYRGFNLTYIKIMSFTVVVDYTTNEEYTRVDLGIYKDKETRDMDINNYMYKDIIVLNGIFSNRQSIYDALRNCRFENSENI